MFVDNENTNARYHGYNPVFAKRAREKQKEAERLRIMKEMADRREREKAERAEARRRVEEAKRTEKASEVVGVPIADPLHAYTVINVMNVKPNAKAIINDVATAYGYGFADIVGASRSRDIIKVRHAAMRMVVDARPDLSLVAIGKVFNRDHTTILSALRKTKKPGAAR